MTTLQKLVAVLALIAAFVAAAMIAVSGFGHKFGAWDYAFARDILLTNGVYLAFAAAGAALLAIVVALARRKWGGIGTGLFAILIAAGAAYVPLTLRAQEQATPALHDLSTDTAHPPAFVALAEQRRASPNGIAFDPISAALQSTAYPDLATYRSRDSAAALYGRAATAVNELGWIVAANVPGQGRLEATAVSEWFGLKDDIVIRVTADGSGARLDIRSASRAGRNDLGTNAAHIRAILAKLK